jgi:hypothetical protein
MDGRPTCGRSRLVWGALVLLAVALASPADASGAARLDLAPAADALVAAAAAPSGFQDTEQWTTVRLTVESPPPGLQLSLGSRTATAPFTREVIEGYANSISARP